LKANPADLQEHGRRSRKAATFLKKNLTGHLKTNLELAARTAQEKGHHQKAAKDRSTRNRALSHEAKNQV
jgi:hypothetical protein